jgi:pilus assembly protein Flp/PilA
MFKSPSKSKHEKGQGLVEYALILVLVSIVVIVALSALGPTISGIFTNINNSLSTGGGETIGAVSQLTTEQSAMLDNMCGKYSGSSFTVDTSGNISSSNTNLNGGNESGIPAGTYSCP